MKNQTHKPNRIATFILGILLSGNDSQFLIGDYEEEFNDQSQSKGLLAAHRWYWFEILSSIPSYLTHTIYWSIVMFKNYLKIAWRNIANHKGYSFINIFGLALGMACCILIMMWVNDELNYDRFHENADNIYRIEQDQNYSGDIFHVYVTPWPFAEGFKEEIPEITNATAIGRTGTMLVNYNENKHFEDNIVSVSPGFLEMFSFPLSKGDELTALNEPYSILLSEEMATKYFGNEEPVGKTISLDNEYNMTVTGVVKDFPDNSSITFDMLVPVEFAKVMGRYNESWGNNSIQTFIQLLPNSVLTDVDLKLTETVNSHREGVNSLTKFMVFPLPDIKLYSYGGYDKSKTAILFVYILSAIAIIILLIACFNFMNLSTARSAFRMKEIGVRKVLGAHRKNLISQFLGESMVLSFMALALAIVIAALLLPQFNYLANKKLVLESLTELWFIGGALCITVITGLLSGSYPALFLSAFKPVNSIKGNSTPGTKSSFFRKVLVVSQFSMSIFLILGTTVIYSQMNYMKNMEEGYNKDHVVSLSMRGKISESYYTLKNELLKNSLITDVTAASHKPTMIGSNSGGAEWEGSDPDSEVLIGTNYVDFDYIQTLGMEILEGRNFSSEIASDSVTAFIVNEKAAKLMGKESVIGEKFDFMGREGIIIGVVKDFFYDPNPIEIQPLATVVASQKFLNHILIKINGSKITESMDEIESTWKKIVPNYPFEYAFLGEEFDLMYKEVEKVLELLRYFAILAILIACLGLFGLASFMAEQKTKEIGIRKVLGSSVSEIVVLLSKQFVFWVLIANAISLPISYYVMNLVLQNFAYRTSIGPFIYIGITLATIVIALATISYQSVKSARRNPADALNYE